MKINLLKVTTTLFNKRLLYNICIAFVAYILYGLVAFLMYTKIRHFGSLVLFQFFFIAILGALMGHIVVLYTEQRKREQEIEELKVENLQSRYDALTNQINRSEEHTSELQSRENLVCRLLLEKKNKTKQKRK